jgi:hypothetical protein
MNINNNIDFEQFYLGIVFGRLDDDLNNLNNVEQHIMKSDQAEYDLNPNCCELEDMDTVILSFHKNDFTNDIIWCVDLMSCEIVKWTCGKYSVEKG